MLKPIGIHEITRTGRIAIGRLSNLETELAVNEDDAFAVGMN